MKPSLITSVFLPDEGALMDLLRSGDAAVAEIRRDLVCRLTRGEGLVAVVNGQPPRALVLRCAIEPALRGKPEGNDLLSVPFG